MSCLRLISCVVLATFLTSSAWALAPNCIERDRMVRNLAKKYDERSIAFGLGDNGIVYELLKSKSGTSWTLVMTTIDGNTCLIASGKHWESLPQITPSTLAH